MAQNIPPSLTNLIDELDNIVETAPGVAFSRNISVNPDKLAELVSEMRANIPKQIKQAEKIIADSRRKVDEANNQAKTIIEQARTQAQQLTSEHEITLMAQEEAERIIDEAYEEARNLRLGAKEYVKERMAQTEERLNALLDGLTSQSIEMQSFVTAEVEQCYKIRQGLLDGSADSGEYDSYDDGYDEEY